MGSLAETPLPALLTGLHRDAFTGELVLSREALVKRFEWRGGSLVGVSSRLAAERLCEILAAAGALEREARARVEQRVRERGCTELQALAQLGAVPPRALLLALAEQLRRSLVSCLDWRNGAFRLEPGDALGVAPALPFDLLALLFEVVGQRWQLHEILVALGPHALTFPTLVPGFRAAWLASWVERDRLLARLDGRTTSYALLSELGDARAAAAFWLLDALGALVHRGAASSTPNAETPAHDEPRLEIVVRRGAPATAAPRTESAGGRAAAAVARDAAATGLRREVQALHERLASLTLWEVLGVARDADGGEVRRAYLRAAKRLHPDRLVQLGLADLKTAANEVFAEIARAHEVLSDPERRRQYEENLVDESVADANRVAEAEAAFRRGDLLLRAGNFRAAVELLERAVTLWPEEGEYLAALAWALHRKTPPESARAAHLFERALALGEHAVWLMRASLVARELGQEARATGLAARARDLDPNVRA